MAPISAKFSNLLVVVLAVPAILLALDADFTVTAAPFNRMQRRSAIPAGESVLEARSPNGYGTAIKVAGHVGSAILHHHSHYDEKRNEHEHSHGGQGGHQHSHSHEGQESGRNAEKRNEHEYEQGHSHGGQGGHQRSHSHEGQEDGNAEKSNGYGHQRSHSHEGQESGRKAGKRNEHEHEHGHRYGGQGHHRSHNQGHRGGGGNPEANGPSPATEPQSQRRDVTQPPSTGQKALGSPGNSTHTEPSTEHHNAAGAVGAHAISHETQEKQVNSPPGHHCHIEGHHHSHHKLLHRPKHATTTSASPSPSATQTKASQHQRRSFYYDLEDLD